MNIKETEQIIGKLFLEWQELCPLDKKNQDNFYKKVNLDWNYHSNKIEGNYPHLRGNGTITDIWPMRWRAFRKRLYGD